MFKRTLLTALAVGFLASSATALAAETVTSAAVGGPDVDISVVSYTSDPQRNDYLFVRATLTNNEASSVSGRSYFTVAYPDGFVDQQNVLSGTIGAGQTVKLHKLKSRKMRYGIPANAPEGTYTVTFYVGEDIADGGSTYSTDTFTFELGPNVPTAAKGGPNVSIDYLGSTEDPQRGDFVFVRAQGTNNEATSVRTRVYFTVDYPTGVDRTYSVGSADFPAMTTLQLQKIKRIKVPVPSDAPAGTYTVTLYIANDIANGGQVYDTDTFTFTLDPVTTCAANCVATTTPEAGPNPFRTATTIRYELADAAPVSLTVYDVQGREVAALVNGTQEAGAHAATLQAGDLPAGLYVWRLVAGTEVSTGRVTLAR